MTIVGGHSMNLRDLFGDMQVAVPDEVVTDITTHSARATPGGLFLACAGLRQHGLDFLDAALTAGVAAVAWEPVEGRRPPVLPDGVADIRVPALRAKLGALADRFFGQPSARLVITGITGTNGKSTTAWLATQALDRLDRLAAYMGTLGYGRIGALKPSVLTTPGCVTVHRRLREMALAGASHVVAEVSSHALDQHRIAGVGFDVAALTNLSRDHLDYHGDMDSYAAAKARLFLDTGVRTAVINVGDGFGARLAGQLVPGTELISVALVDADAGEPTARVTGRLTGSRAAGLGLRLSGDFGDAEIHSPLWGRFNAENLAIAAGILLALEFPLASAAEALEHCTTPPGRMQLIDAGDDCPRIVVDFAHTPAALGQALSAVREHCCGAVWCVFGCGGERDRGKRAPMGATAARLADQAIITDDNPRGEDPASIVDDIVAGFPADSHHRVIHDRTAAIAYAVQSAAPADVILLAGKGHESVQIIGTESLAFCDIDAARAALGLTE